jgi:hypothetical protein
MKKLNQKLIALVAFMVFTIPSQSFGQNLEPISITLDYSNKDIEDYNYYNDTLIYTYSVQNTGVDSSLSTSIRIHEIDTSNINVNEDYYMPNAYYRLSLGSLPKLGPMEVYTKTDTIYSYSGYRKFQQSQQYLELSIGSSSTTKLSSTEFFTVAAHPCPTWIDYETAPSAEFNYDENTVTIRGKWINRSWLAPHTSISATTSSSSQVDDAWYNVPQWQEGDENANEGNFEITLNIKPTTPHPATHYVTLNTNCYNEFDSQVSFTLPKFLSGSYPTEGISGLTASPTNHGSYSSVDLAWDAVVDVDRYLIQLKQEQGEDQWNTFVVTDPEFSTEFLKPNTSYIWRVTGQGSYNGEKANTLYTEGSFTSPIDALECSTPINLNSSIIDKDGTDYIQLNWDSSENSEAVIITYWENEANKFTTNTRPGKDSLILIDLAANTTYTWQAQSYCSVARLVKSPSSDEQTLTSTSNTLDCSVAPSGLSTSSTMTDGIETIQFAWTNNVTPEQSLVLYRETGTNWKAIYTNGAANSTTALISEGNTSYEWQVQNTCSNEYKIKTAYSSQSTFTSQVNAFVCSKATNLSATTSGDGLGIDLSWTNNSIPLENTLIIYKGSDETTWHATNLTNGESTVSLSNLKQNSLYEYRIAQTCDRATGMKVQTLTENFTSPDVDLECGQPSNIVISETDQAVSIDWDQAGGATVDLTLILFYENGNNSYKGVWLRDASTSTTLTILNPNTTYDFRLKSYCGVSSSTYAEKVSHTTSAAIVPSGAREMASAYDYEIDANVVTYQQLDYVLLYPNPSTTGVFNVSGISAASNVIVYNAMGQKVTSLVIDEYSSSLNIAHLDKGLYFVSIENNPELIKVIIE